MKIRLLLAAGCCCPFLALAPLHADSVRLSDDASAASNSTVPAGTAPALTIKGKPGKAARTVGYLRFDLGDLPAGTAADSVAKATLRVFVTGSKHPGGTFDVQAVTSDWTEDALTGATAPALGGVVATGFRRGPRPRSPMCRST